MVQLKYFVSFSLIQILGVNLGGAFNDVNVLGVSWALGLELYVGTIFFSIVFHLKKKCSGVLSLYMYNDFYYFNRCIKTIFS